MSVCPTSTLHPATLLLGPRPLRASVHPSRRRTFSHSLPPPPPAPLLLLNRSSTHFTTGAQLRPLEKARAWTSSRHQWVTLLQEPRLPILGHTHRLGPPPPTTVTPQCPHFYLHLLKWLSLEPRAHLLPLTLKPKANNIATFLLVVAARLLQIPQSLAACLANPLSSRPVTRQQLKLSLRPSPSS